MDKDLELFNKTNESKGTKSLIDNAVNSIDLNSIINIPELNIELSKEFKDKINLYLNGLIIKL